MHPLFITASLAGALLVSGCGKPPASSGGPPPGDFPVSAVIARAETQTVEEQARLVATLESRDAITVVSELDARVMNIEVQEGQPVSKGARMFLLDDVQAKARLDEANAGFELARATLERNRQLLENKTISQSEFDRAEADFLAARAGLALAEDALAKTVISAPFDGVAGERRISTGQFVTRGQVLLDLIQVDPLEIVFDAPERYLSRIRPGMRTTFAPDALPAESYTGKVVYVATVIAPRTRTVRVKAELTNAERRLKPGMFGRAILVLAEREQALVIPEAAVQFNGQSTMVVAVNASGKSEFRPVETGQRMAGRVEITRGLRAGEWVVVEGFQKMGPGMTVVAAPESIKHGVTPGPLGTPAPPGSGVAPATGSGSPAPAPGAPE